METGEAGAGITTPAGGLLGARRDAWDWCACSLGLVRGAPLTTELLVEVAPWIERAAVEVPALPPLAVIADIGRLLRHGPPDLCRRQAPVSGSRELETTLQAYEEHLLGRITADPKLADARDALLALPEHLHTEAIAVISLQLLERLQLDWCDLDCPPSAMVRQALQQPPTDLMALRSERQRSELEERLERSYRALTRASRSIGTLLSGADVSLLESFPHLRVAADRLALVQMSDAAAAFDRAFPARLRCRARPGGSTPTRIEAESTYPVGGYASLATGSSIENLVCSELVYLEPERELDLFQVRWAMGELLSYTRDESMLCRQRRCYSFTFAADLTMARVKDRGTEWQRLVLALGLVVATVRRLHQWLGEDELRFRIGFDEHEGERPLAAEAGLCRLLLRQWIEAGTVVVEHGDEAEEESLQVRISSEAPEEAAESLHLVLGKAKPVLIGVDAPQSESESEPLWQRWTAVANHLLRQLV
jgi:hypothetical protein